MTGHASHSGSGGRSETLGTVLIAFGANLVIAHAKLAERAIQDHPAVRGVGGLLSLQVGPEDLLVAVRVELADPLSTDEIEQVMDELQHAVGEAVGRCSTCPSTRRRCRRAAGRRPFGCAQPDDLGMKLI